MIRHASVAVLLLAAQGCATPSRDRVTVYAATSLTDVLSAAAAGWSPDADVRFSFAASSTVARQVQAGAPADVVALADTKWMDWLDEHGAIESATRIRPAGNRLVVIAPVATSTPRTDLFTAALDLPAGARIAMGDPAHVPVGRYGRQAMVRAGLWAALEGRLATADNTRAALALVERGAAPRGIVYATDARASERVRVLATIPDSLHDPVVYEMAAVRGRSRPETESFLRFLESDQAARLFREAGFTVRAAP